MKQLLRTIALLGLKAKDNGLEKRNVVAKCTYHKYDNKVHKEGLDHIAHHLHTPRFA